MIYYDLKEFRGNQTKFDVCVVGGGPAGISLALRLARNGLKVCLVESGGLKMRRANQRLNRVENRGVPYKDLSAQRGRYLGGTSNLWGGNCIPFDRVDFVSRDVKGRAAWPMSYDELSSFIKEAQTLMGVDTANFGDDLLARINLMKAASDPSDFEWRAWQFCDFPFRFGEKFFEELENSDLISVLLNANFTECEFHGDGTRVKKIWVRDLDSQILPIKASKYVLACGGVENARLLLNLIERDDSPLKAITTTLGKNFAEHPNAVIGYLKGPLASEIYSQHKIRYLNRSKEIKPGLAISATAQLAQHTLNGIVSVWPVPDERSIITKVKLVLELIRRRDFGIKFLISSLLILPGIISLLPHVRHRMRGGVISTPHKPDQFEVRLMTESVANPKSRICLTDRRDALGLKVASLRWQLTTEDRESFIKIAELAKKHFEQHKEVQLELVDWLEDPKANWTNYLNTNGHYGHHMGTTKMGVDAAESVVDENCKIHGLKNLYVAGSSVFPAFGFANPTLTIVALSLRLGDHLSTQ